MAKILEESSLIGLYVDTINAFPNTTLRQHATHTIKIPKLDWIPFVGLKTLFVKGLVQNEGREYTPIILFKNVNYGDGNLRLMASDGIEYKMDKLSLEDTNVLVRCSCPDFSWRFNYYDHLDKSLFGSKRKKYESKGLLPPANPKQLPGICKHLIKMTEALAEAGLFLD